MAAYAVGRIKITDLEKFKEYQKGVPATIAKHGGRYLVRGGETTTREGEEETNRIVILEFDTMDALKGWYDSDDYADLKAMRLSASEGQMVLVEGYET